MSLGDNLKRLRLEENKTLKEVSEDIGLTIGYLSDMERNVKKNPSSEVLQRIADYFNVSVDYLFGRTDKKLPFGLSKYTMDEIRKLKNKAIIGNKISDLIMIQEAILIDFILQAFIDKKPSIEEVRKAMDQTNKESKDPNNPYLNQENYSDEELQKIIDEYYSEKDPLIDEINSNNNLRILLHEASGMNEEDLERIIQIAKAWNVGKDID